MSGLEWRAEDGYGDEVTKYIARSDLGGDIFSNYAIHPSEKYGGVNIYGLQKRPSGYDTGWAETLDEAKAIAEDDYQRRGRLQAWREYMATNDPPEQP